MKSQLMFAASLPRPCEESQACGRAGGPAPSGINATVRPEVYPADRDSYSEEIRRILRRKEIVHRTFVWVSLGVCVFILMAILWELT